MHAQCSDGIGQNVSSPMHNWAREEFRKNGNDENWRLATNYLPAFWFYQVRFDDVQNNSLLFVYFADAATDMCEICVI